MVKANTDPGAPAAVLQLLAQIESVQLLPDSDASTSSNEAPINTEKPLALLRRCLDLTLESSDDLSASFKYGLDALRLWVPTLLASSTMHRQLASTSRRNSSCSQ